MRQRKTAINEMKKITKFPAFPQDVTLTGDHAASSAEPQMMYRTPSGTELLTIFKAMDKDLEKNVRSFQKMIDPNGFWGTGDKDNYDEEDYDNDDYDDDDGPRPRDRGKRRHKIKGVKVEVFFQYVKSKFNVAEQVALSDRLTKVVGALKSAEVLGQTNLYEELALQLSVLVREQEMAVAGCSRWLKVETVQYFVQKIEDRICNFVNLKEYPRVVPAEPAKRIAEAKGAGVFDDYYILYTDLTGEKFESTVEMIRKKDPIVFGTFTAFPDRLYFICDWVDEHCDLTLDKMLSTIRVDDPTYKMEEIGEVSEDFIKGVLADIEKRHLRLKMTNPSNYRRLMREEERDAKRREEEARKATAMSSDNPESWFKGLIDMIANKVVDKIED